MPCWISVSATFSVSCSLVITLAYYYGDNVDLSPVFHGASVYFLLTARAQQSARFLLHGERFFGSPVVVCRFCNPTSVKATTLAYFRHWIVSPESLTQFEIQRSISQSKFLSWLLFVCLFRRYELQAIVCYCVVQNLEEFLVKWHWNLSQNFTWCSLTLRACVFSLETLDWSLWTAIIQAYFEHMQAKNELGDHFEINTSHKFFRN